MGNRMTHPVMNFFEAQLLTNLQNVSRPEWCDEEEDEEDEEEDEGLEAISRSGESATGIRSSRSLSLLAMTIADFSSPIIKTERKRLAGLFLIYRRIKISTYIL